MIKLNKHIGNFAIVLFIIIVLSMIIIYFVINGNIHFRTFCPYIHLKTAAAPLTFAMKFCILSMLAYYGYYALKR